MASIVWIHGAHAIHDTDSLEAEPLGKTNLEEADHRLVSLPFPRMNVDKSGILNHKFVASQHGLEVIQNLTRILDRDQGPKEYGKALLFLAEGYLRLERPNEAMAVYKGLASCISYKKSMSITPYDLSHQYDSLPWRLDLFAYKIYDKCQKSGGIKDSRIFQEMNHSWGDVYFQRKQFRKSVDAYQKALHEYPEFKFPHVYYNLAESLFWLGQWNQSLKSYHRFIKTFPSHPYESYALARIGELLDILGANKEKIMGTFSENHFRFQGHPGAQLSRVRWLSEKMKEMKSQNIHKALVEMREVAKKSSLIHMREFVVLKAAESFQHRNEHDRSLSYLITLLKRSGDSDSINFREFARKRIVENIRFQMREFLIKSNYMGVLEKYKEYEDVWDRYLNLKTSPQTLDIHYFLAYSFEMSGFDEESLRRYKAILSRLNYLNESGYLRNVESISYLRESLRLRVAVSYVKTKRQDEAFLLFKKIGIVPNKRYRVKNKIERALWLAKIYEKRKQYLRAQNILEEEMKGLLNFIQPSQGALFISAMISLSKLYLNIENENKAKAILRQAEIWIQKNQDFKIGDSLKKRFFLTKAEVLKGRGEYKEALDIYMKFLKDPISAPWARFVYYKVGDILLNQDQIQDVQKIASTFSEEESHFYHRWIEERLDYKRWIKKHKSSMKMIQMVARLHEDSM